MVSGRRLQTQSAQTFILLYVKTSHLIVKLAFWLMNACGSVVNLSINGQKLIASCLWLVRTWLADFHTLRGVLCIAHVL